MKRSLNHIIYCRMVFEAASTVFSGQAMQTPTVQPPAAATKLGNANISAPSEAMATLKLTNSSSVPCDETGKALSQVPLSFSAVSINLAVDT